MRRILHLLALLLLSVHLAFAQSGNGEISGKILDEKKQPVIGATVVVEQGGIRKGGAKTNFDGVYSIKPLSAASNYVVRVTYIGYKQDVTSDVRVTSDNTTRVNVNLDVAALTTKGEVVIKETRYKDPLIKKDEPPTKRTITGDEINRLATRSTSSMASMAPGVYQAKEGGALSMGGARSDATVYIIDGVRVRGSRGVNLPAGSIDQMTVISSGLPAKYGDVTGGVVTITTRGPSRDLHGGLTLEKSVDGFGHNLAAVNLSGPLVSKKDKYGAKTPLIGFFLAGDYAYDKDNDPSYYGNYRAKGDVLNNLQQTPLFLNPNGGGAFQYRAEYVTMNELEKVTQRQNALNQASNLVGKLDFQPAENISVTVGGSFNYAKTSSYIRGASLFAPEANPQSNNYTGRGYVRFTQRLGQSSKDLMNDADKKPSLIQNAFYTVQVDYTRDYSRTWHQTHKDNLFDYGYLGKFTSYSQAVYQPNYLDTLTGEHGVAYLGNNPTKITFDRSEMNPILANYTSQVFREAITPLRQLNDAFGVGALRNGDVPRNVYQLWNNVGAQVTSMSYSQAEQVGVAVDGSFDIVPNKGKGSKHAIEFGLYYEQRVDRGYSVAGNGLWSQMRLLANRQLGSFDYANPIYRVNGQNYTKDDINNGTVIFGDLDTITYNRIYTANDQSFFDKNLRSKLGLAQNSQDVIDIDNLDPSTYSLKMFSADELLNNGSPLVSYYGYDAYGNRQSKQPSFNDFFTQKDAYGNFTRAIGAFRPVYMGGYLLDRFTFRDMSFNVGVRIDRYDANNKMMKDPYSLYAERTVADVAGKQNAINGGTHPSNMGSDYVVYVNTNSSQDPRIVGYRNGDRWYDPLGREVSDPRTLSITYANGQSLTPYLQNATENIKDTNFNANGSFEDYKPQVNIMPRVQFSFPISDVAQFYAHYDVLVQRPRSFNNATPDQYYFFVENAGQGAISNPALKPEKTIDYEVGFQQAVTKSSALTIAAFYKERRDMIQLRQYAYAYPFTYTTYGNRDFSTVKGLKVVYDLRRTSNFQLNMSYTLQFAEGTGDNAAFTQSLIQNGLANVQPYIALGIDSRHLIVANLDYRYMTGEGPTINGHHFLQNAGANLIFRARSGEPYTRYSRAVPLVGGDFTSTPIIGTINGSRLPWNYNLDLKVDKDFVFNLGKTVEGGKRSKQLVVNAFCYVQNLLNTKNILGVYGYTGNASDDGYLASPQGQTALNAPGLANKQSFYDLYTLAMLNPGMVAPPRRINLGLGFSF